MKFEEIVSNIKNKIFSPVYFLSGEQPYYIDFICNLLEEEILTEDEKGFNQTVVYGKDSNAQDIILTARQYPMMATYQVVIVKEAQDLLNIEMLNDFVANPPESSILVLCYKYKKLDKRSKLAKTLQGPKTVFFETPKLYDNEVPAWIENYCLKKGYRISPKAAMLLGFYLGTDLQKIVNEIEKLTLVVQKGQQITESHIEKHVGISKDYNVFELQNALGARDAIKATRVVMYFADNEKAGALPMVTISLYNYFAKVMRYHFATDKSRTGIAQALGVNPFFVKDYTLAATNYKPRKISEIFSILEEYDLKGKGVNNSSAPSGELLKEMIFKILN